MHQLWLMTWSIHYKTATRGGLRSISTLTRAIAAARELLDQGRDVSAIEYDGRLEGIEAERAQTSSRSFAGSVAGLRATSPVWQTPKKPSSPMRGSRSVSYTHLRAHETGRNLVCRLLLEKKKK